MLCLSHKESINQNIFDNNPIRRWKKMNSNMKIILIIGKKIKTWFRFSGLLLIISLLLTSTLDVQALSENETTISVIMPNSSSTETGDFDQEPSTSMTTVAPSNTADSATYPGTQETREGITASPETASETSILTPPETQTETENSSLTPSESPTETASETAIAAITETPTETPIPPQNSPKEENKTIAEEKPIPPDLSLKIIANPIENCESVSFNITLINAGGPLHSEISVKLSANPDLGVNPSILIFSQAGEQQSVSVVHPWNKDNQSLTLIASIIGKEGDLGVGVAAKESVEKPEYCQQKTEPSDDLAPILDIAVNAHDYNYDADSVSFEVTVMNLGSTNSGAVAVNITTSPEMEEELVQPGSLFFDNISYEEGSNSKTQWVTIASPWANGITSLTLKAFIGGVESDPGFGKYAEASAKFPQEIQVAPLTLERSGNRGQEEPRIQVDVTCSMHGGSLRHKWIVKNIMSTKIHFKWFSTSGEFDGSWISLNPGNTSTFYTNSAEQTITVSYQYLYYDSVIYYSWVWSSTILEYKLSQACDSNDLSLSITDVKTSCLGVEATVRISNPNQFVNATNISVKLEIEDGSEYISDTMPLAYTFASIPKSGYSEHIFTFDTNSDWISATIYDSIKFSISIINADQIDPNSENDYVNKQFFNPGDCLTAPTLNVSCGQYGGVYGHVWSLYNPNSVTLSYAWTGTSDPSSGNGSVGAGGTSYILTNLESQTLSLSYEYDDVSYSLPTKSAETCLQDLGLTYQCLQDGHHQWTVTNPNKVDVGFTWWTDSTGEKNDTPTIIAADGGTATFQTDSSLHTASVSYTYAGETHTTSRSADACIVKLNLDYECETDGRHKWTVTNSNAVDVNFTWWTSAPNQGDGNPINVSSGGTATFYTDNTAHTAYVEFTDGSNTYTTDKDAAVCLIPLELDYACHVSNGDHIWTVTNSNGFNQDFSWSSDNGENGSETVLANSTKIFTTNNLSQIMTVSYVFDGQNKSVQKQADVCLIPLELDYDCHEYNGSHMWTVTNANGFAIDFTWATEDGLQSGGPITVTAGPGTTATFTTDGTAHKVIISYQYGGDNKTIEKVAEACKSSDLILSYMCGFATDAHLHWSVMNPYTVDLTVDWKVVGGTESGSFSAAAGIETLFTTEKGLKTVAIIVDGVEVDQEDGGDACCEELMLTYTCLDNGQQQWTVTNNNAFDQFFTWSSSSGQSGSDTVLANSTATFLTDNKDHTITIKYSHYPFPEKTSSMEAEVCKISTDEPEEEPTTTASTSPYIPASTITETGIEWIVFTTLRDGNLEVYRLDGIEGIGNFKLYNLSKSDWIDTRPNRSFDDQWVTFQSNRDGNLEIYVTDNVGSEQIRLTDNPANDKNPVFSPDNTNIVFQSDRNGSWDLYMVNRLTGEEVQFTDHSADEINPSFSSSNANLVVYESNKNGNQDIFLLNIVTGEEYQITNGEGDEIRPILSPNAQKIAYLSSVDGVMNLFVIGIDGENPLQITNGDGDTMNPTWSPDGTRLAYQSKRNGNIDIYTYDLRDGTEYRLTDNAGQDTAPSWDKTGTNVYYTAKIDKIALDIYRVFWKGGNSIYITNNPSSDMWSK